MVTDEILTGIKSDTSFLLNLLKQDFSVLHHKLIALYLLSLEGDYSNLEPQPFKTGTIADLANLKNRKNLYREFKKHAKSLKMDLEIAGQESFSMVECFHTRFYQGQRGLFHFALDPRISNRLEIEFSAINAESMFQGVLKLKDVHSIRLWYWVHLLKGHQNSLTATIGIKDLRVILLQDKWDKLYPRFANFNARVIDKAVTSINEFTDQHLECHKLPANKRQVREIHFISRRKNKVELAKHSIDSSYAELPAYQLLTEKGLNSKVAIDRINELSRLMRTEESVLSYCLDAIKYVEDRNRLKRIEGEGGQLRYLIATLKANYHSFDEEQFLQKQRMKLVDAKQSNERNLDQVKATKMEWNQECKAQLLMSWLNGLSSEEQKLMFNQLNEAAKLDSVMSIYSSITLENIEYGSSLYFAINFFSNLPSVTAQTFTPTRSEFVKFCDDKGYNLTKLEQQEEQLAHRIEQAS